MNDHLFLQIIGWYSLLSVAIGLWIAGTVRYERWKHDTRRDITFSPNKDKLGYLVAFLIGCPFLNLGCLVLFVIAQYKVAHDKRSRKAWIK